MQSTETNWPTVAVISGLGRAITSLGIATIKEKILKMNKCLILEKVIKNRKKTDYKDVRISLKLQKENNE